MKNRLALAQLALFLVIGVACSYYVLSNVLGPRAITAAMTVTVRMPDTGGLTAQSQVTYRGVGVGEVADIQLDPEGAGVRVRLELDPDTRIPHDTTAVVTQQTPMAIVRLDLRPDGEDPPYLRDGSVIPGQHTRRPLPLERLLVEFMEVADSLPAEDVAVIGDALATGLNGATPELIRILDNSQTLLRFAGERTPQLRRLADHGRQLLGDSGDRLRRTATAMRQLTGALREQEPAIRGLLHDVPDPARRVARMMTENQPALTTLLGNLVTTAQLVSVRAPAVEQTLISLPDTLTKLGSIVEGDTANFYLIASQGPVCYTETPRRTPTATEPREPDLTWHCPPGPDLAQRGAANAPRPEGSPSEQAPAPKNRSYDPASGRPLPFDLGSSGGQQAVLGPRSWSSILLQGVQ